MFLSPISYAHFLVHQSNTWLVQGIAPKPSDASPVHRWNNKDILIFHTYIYIYLQQLQWTYIYIFKARCITSNGSGTPATNPKRNWPLVTTHQVYCPSDFLGFVAFFLALDLADRFGFSLPSPRLPLDPCSDEVDDFIPLRWPKRWWRGPRIGNKVDWIDII